MNEQEKFEDWWKQDCDTTMNPYSNTSMMYWAWEAWKAGRKTEREACAKLCDAECNPTPNEGHITTYQSGGYIIAEYLASAIRSRGQDV
jgi:hypothetical protein